MLEQLGSMPFSSEYLAEGTVGHWAIEKDPDCEPRMYVDDVMLGLIGLEERKSPEENFRAWLQGIDVNYLDSVFETERLNTNGIHAEVQYPWHYPDGRTILIRCEGMRNYAYTKGIRTEGRHRNITDLTRLQKESAVLSALTKDFECVNYVLLRENKMDDIAIQFRTSSKLKQLIPEWDRELSFHNRLGLLLGLAASEEDADYFRRHTRREVILEHLSAEPAYYVNCRALVDGGNAEYFQLKFIADRDAEGRVAGIVVGIHNIDDEMRQELKQREKVEQLVAEKTEELNIRNRTLAKVNERIISMIGEIVESRDEESGRHVHRIKYFTRILGMQVMKDLPEYNLTVKDISAITALSPLHDVGKIKIPDGILLKEGRLTKDEYEVMKTHCDKGCEILGSMAGVWDDDLARLSMDICRYHHEKWDGRGYPYGLKGDTIPIAAQIVSVADAYDALVSERCYKDAYTHDEAYSMIMEGKCGQYSDKLLSCFAKCRDAFRESTERLAAIAGDDESEERLFYANEGFISEAVPLVEELSRSMPGGFFIYDARGDEKLIFFNDLMPEYFGCSSREEFIEFTGNSFRGIVHPGDYEAVEKSIWNQIESSEDKFDHVIYRIVRKDGKVHRFDDYGRLIRSGDMGDVFFVFVSDLGPVA